MKLNEVLEQESELLVEQQLTESILSMDDEQFEAPVTADDLLAQLGISNG